MPLWEIRTSPQTTRSFSLFHPSVYRFEMNQSTYIDAEARALIPYTFDICFQPEISQTRLLEAADVKHLMREHLM